MSNPGAGRRPVLVGVGTCADDAEALELMVCAARASGDDAGAPELLRLVDRVAVTKGTWEYGDPARGIARAVGAPDAVTHLVDLGIPQQTVIDETMAALLAGDIDVALVVGGEAKAHEARARERSVRADAAGIADVFRGGGGDAQEPDVHQRPEGDLVDPAEIAAGLWAPIDQYALLESALGAVEGRTPSELRDDVSVLYERFNRVAGTNPEAAFPAPMTAQDLAAPGPANRPLAFPYNKWHATQWTVDQAAALLLCTVEVADRVGVPDDRRIHPLVGLSSSHALPLTQRRALHRWPAMGVLGAAAVERLGHPLVDCDHHELYSCFPVAVRIQQRELGLPLDGTPTVTGGMAFAGGPFNNYVFQATAAMARRLRAAGGRGLVTTVSGLLTKPGLAVWASEPDGEAPLLGDLGDRAAAATERVEDVRIEHEGDATVAACTVTHEGQAPVEVVVVADTDDGARVIGRSRDAATIDAALTDGLVGRPLRGRWPSPWSLAASPTSSPS